ncbi:MAG: hypothetical protein HOO96_28485 [Polyangiaceae bacterium]|nr:hypothetical protein [Polyangiaceae bacterium]
MNQLDDEAMFSALGEAGVDASSAVSAWTQSASLLAALDAIGRMGGHTLVKIDGERDGSQVYTVLVSGGRLGSDHFRRDGDDLPTLLREALRLGVAPLRQRQGVGFS